MHIIIKVIIVKQNWMNIQIWVHRYSLTQNSIVLNNGIIFYNNANNYLWHHGPTLISHSHSNLLFYNFSCIISVVKDIMVPCLRGKIWSEKWWIWWTESHSQVFSHQLFLFRISCICSSFTFRLVQIGWFTNLLLLQNFLFSCMVYNTPYSTETQQKKCYSIASLWQLDLIVTK